MTKKVESEYTVDELLELVEESRVLGPDRADDPQQLARVGEILDYLGDDLREDIVTRIASEDSIMRTKIKRFIAAHHLTPAEAKLVESLCVGRSTAEHAELCSISPNTVRTHMQRIREKVGVKRQADVVRRALE